MLAYKRKSQATGRPHNDCSQPNHFSAEKIAWALAPTCQGRNFAIRPPKPAFPFANIPEGARPMAWDKLREFLGKLPVDATSIQKARCWALAARIAKEKFLGINPRRRTNQLQWQRAIIRAWYFKHHGAAQAEFPAPAISPGDAAKPKVARKALKPPASKPGAGTVWPTE